MAGNAKPRGAVRKSKKGPTTGSGGNKKRRLEGKGPTPKAEDRPYHAAAKRKKAAERASSKGSAAAKKPVSRKFTKADAPRGEIVAGRNAVLEALRESVPATELLVARSIDVDDRVAESLQIALNHGLSIREAHRAEVEGISPNSQGIILAIKPYQYSSFDEIVQRAKNPMLLVALDGVTDPRNLGAIVRSAAAFGASGVLMTERRAAGMTASAWKSSAGAAARLPIAQVTNLVNIMNQAKENDYFVIGLDGDGEANFENFKLYDQSLFLIVGSEGKGISRLVREKCDQILSIQITNKVESLNASVATAIALHQISSKR